MGFFEDVDVTGVDEDKSSIKEAKKDSNEATVSMSPDELLDEAFEEMMPLNEEAEKPLNKRDSSVDKPNLSVEQNKSKPPVQKSTPVKENVKKSNCDSACETFISKDTVIDGSIKCESICIAGTVTGEVCSKGNIDVIDTAVIKGGANSESSITVSGTLKGKVKAESVVIDSGRILNGDLNAGSVLVQESAIVIAPITAQTLEVAGAVKGDIDVKDKVILRPTAIIQGNITSASISIEDGASIDGTCTQTYAKIKPSDFFSNIDVDE